MNGVSWHIGDASDIVYSYTLQSQTGHRLGADYKERGYTLAVFLGPNRIGYIVVIISGNTPPYIIIIYRYIPVLFHVTCPTEIQPIFKKNLSQRCLLTFRF
jgi:hypothetical protein